MTSSPPPPADTDVDLIVDMVGGTIFYRSYVTGMSLDDDTLRRSIRRALETQGS